LKKLKLGREILPLLQINPPRVRSTNKLLKKVYLSGTFSNSGSLHKQVSRALGDRVSNSFEGVLVNNNTMGLTAALLAVGVQGKHVLVSNFTFAATLQSILLAGGVPVVCDVEADTLEMSPKIVSRFLSDSSFNFGSVVPTRVLGYVNDFSSIVECCNSFNVPVVVDAAAAYPARENQWNFANQATFEIFSFHATKVFGIGEGGLIVGAQKDISEVTKRLNFGFTSEDKMEFVDGLNAKADEFTAARASVRFASYTRDVDARRKFASHYEDFVSSSNQVSSLKSNEKTVFAYFPLIFRELDLLLQFKREIDPKISSRRYYFPTLFRGYRGTNRVVFDPNLDVSEAIAPRILCLPVYCRYDKKLPTQIVSQLKKTLDSIS
jgi:dTDP-4-amino-4,6-dideoxygalactose transaminase